MGDYQNEINSMLHNQNYLMSGVNTVYPSFSLGNLVNKERKAQLNIINDYDKEKQDIKTAYYYNWLYHASFSPLWKSRIAKYNGYVDEENKLIVFDEEIDIQNFYDEYGYEPDEQSEDVENKTIKDIKKQRTWLSFYNQHKNSGIIEIEEDILTDIDKVAYKF